MKMSRMDKMRRMSRQFVSKGERKLKVSLPMLVFVVVAGIWAIVRFITSICYFF